MKVVIASIVLPYPPMSGGAQGIFSIIEELRHQHEVTFIFPVNGDNTMPAMHKLKKRWPEVDLRPYGYLRQMCYPRFIIDKAKRAYGLHFKSGDSDFIVHRLLDHYGYYMTRDFSRFVNGIIAEKQPDLVQVEFYPYLKVADLLPAGFPKVFVHHEIRCVRNERFLQDFALTEEQKQQSQAIAAEEVVDLNKYDAVIALTDNDRQTLRDMGVTVPLYTSPLAVSTSLLDHRPWQGDLFFVGGFSHTPNEEGMQWFLSQVAPLVKWPAGCRLNLIGKGWTEEWLRQYNSSALTVKLHGFVERLDEVAAGCIMIVPILSGSGMRMKILEGAALSTPIITTTVGVEGIGLSHDVSCLVADTPKDFAEALQRMMQSESLRYRLARNARQTYDQHYSRQSVANIRQQIWQQVVEHYKL